MFFHFSSLYQHISFNRAGFVLVSTRSPSRNSMPFRSAGVPPSTVKNILNGARKKPGVVTIKMLCAGQYPWGGSELYSIPEVHRKYRKTHGQKPISVVQ